MNRRKIIVTGSNGQLGSELRDLSPAYTDFEFHFFSREDFPIHDSQRALELFNSIRPDYLINCAAYTAVDKAETEKELAMQINGTAVGMLASLCNDFGTRFIHISTDYVFDGNATRPLSENDPVDPVNYYGATKLAGEQLALQNNPESLVIRTSWVYSWYGKNFVKTMMRLMREKEQVGVVNDQKGAPTYAADLAEAIMKIISSGKWVAGLYHFSNAGNISWFDFATAIRDLLHSSCEVKPITTKDFPTPAKRPAYSVMDTSRLQNVYGIEMKPWRASLEQCLNKLLAE